jgi:hypothetical protein
MGGGLDDRVAAFVGAVDDELTALAGRSHRAECLVEAGDLVAAVLDADGRFTTDELSAWIDAVGRHLTPPMIVAPERLRDGGMLEGRSGWLAAPSTLFDLLVRADGRDGTRRSHRYYTHALEVAHAVAAIDQVPSPSEIEAIDRFRGVLLAAMDGAGVARPGRGGAASHPGPAAIVPTSQAPAAADAPARPLDELLAELDELVGLADVKADVRRLTSLLRIQGIRAERGMPTVDTSNHLVFTGNPGTGKTTVARLLGQIYRTLGVLSRGHLVETDRSQLVAGYVGQTAAKTRAVLESALGGTLLVDEAYALARGGPNDFGLEAVDTLVKFMEDHRDDLAVVAAGYPDEMETLIDANPGLASRFTRTIEFPDYTDAELLAIFALICERNGYHPDASAATALDELLATTPRGRGFGNARFVRNVFEQAVALHALRLADVARPTDEQLTTLVGADITSV